MRGFVIAMENEAACVIGNLTAARATRAYGRHVVRGRLGGAPVLVVVSGVGKANAAAATQFAIQSGADEIVNTGVCGGCEPGMEVGDVYEVARAVEYDFDLADLNGTAVGVLNERASPYIPLAPFGRHPAKTLGTGDHFNDKADDLPLLRTLGVGLRDMEGAAVAHVCETAGVTCRALKCVTNVVGAGGTLQYAANLARCLGILKDCWRARDV